MADDDLKFGYPELSNTLLKKCALNGGCNHYMVSGIFLNGGLVDAQGRCPVGTKEVVRAPAKASPEQKSGMPASTVP